MNKPVIQAQPEIATQVAAVHQRYSDIVNLGREHNLSFAEATAVVDGQASLPERVEPLESHTIWNGISKHTKRIGALMTAAFAFGAVAPAMAERTGDVSNTPAAVAFPFDYNAADTVKSGEYGKLQPEDVTKAQAAAARAVKNVHMVDKAVKATTSSLGGYRERVETANTVAGVNNVKKAVDKYAAKYADNGTGGTEAPADQADTTTNDSQRAGAQQQAAAKAKAKAQAKAKAEAEAKQHQGRYADAEDAKTVAGFVKRMDTGKKTFWKDLRYTGSDKRQGSDKADHTTTQAAVNSMLRFPEYGGGKADVYDYGLAAVDAALNSNLGNTAKFWNLMNGHNGRNDNFLPAGMSLEKARHQIMHKLLKDHAKFAIEKLKAGTVLDNYGQISEDQVFYADTIVANGSQEWLTITFDNGIKLLFKLDNAGLGGGDDCINFNVIVPRQEQPSSPAQPSQPSQPSSPAQPAQPGHPGSPAKPGKPGHPGTPTPPETPPVTPKGTNKNTPTGKDGEPKGQGGDGQDDKRQQGGDANDKAHRQPPAQTPPPIEQDHPDESTPTVPAETTPVQPATPGTDTTGGAEAPAQPVNQGDVPQPDDQVGK